MAAPTDIFDVAGLRLHSGEGRRLELAVHIDDFELSGDRYTVVPEQIPVVLDVSRMTGGGYALRLRFAAEIEGPCMRCLDPAGNARTIDVREVSQPAHAGDDDELESEYVAPDGALDMRAWAHDAFGLALPAAILCRGDCAGLCPVCGVNLNDAGSDHHHDEGPDRRWAKLSELKFDSQ